MGLEHSRCLVSEDGSFVTRSSKTQLCVMFLVLHPVFVCLLRFLFVFTQECGAVHKVLENSSDPFIIAEYHPFKPGTHILSMLLDSSQVSPPQCIPACFMFAPLSGSILCHFYGANIQSYSLNPTRWAFAEETLCELQC